MHKVINALIQTLGIIGVQYFGWIYAIYPSLALSMFMVAVQTLAISSVFSRYVAIKERDANKINAKSTSFLISILYIATAYQAHLLGYSIIAGVIIAHASINMLTILMKADE